MSNISEAKAKREHHNLAIEIRIHDDAYYKQDAPIVDDAKYDALRKRLLALEAEFPALATKDSPSQNVGVKPTGRFGKITHKVAMKHNRMSSMMYHITPMRLSIVRIIIIKLFIQFPLQLIYIIQSFNVSFATLAI